MKACFFLQRRFAWIGHAMACQIKDISPQTEFCAIVNTRPSLEFIQNQKEIKYTSILFDEDIYRSLHAEVIDPDYLNMLEKKYGVPNLWPYLYIDRVIMNGQFVREYPHNKPTLSYENMLRCIQVNAKAIIDFLDREKPDTVVISVVGSITSTLLYHIAQKMGIQVINIDTARINNRIVFSEDDRTLTWVKKRFEEIQKGRLSNQKDAAIEFLKKFRENPAPYDIDNVPEFYAKKGRMEVLRFLQPKRLIRSIPWHLSTIFKDIKRTKDADHDDNYIWFALWDKLKRKSRVFVGYADLYSKPNFSERYAYIPLHTDPEISTMRYAPYYVKQDQLIQAAAHALPINVLLYVKEHPGMVGYRTREFYKRFVGIPNVRLIDPNIPGNEVSLHAELIITATSTTAWEAMIHKKPVITFGDVFYNDIPGVKRCRGFEELPYLIKEQLENWEHDESNFVNFTSALLEDSVPVDFNDIWNNAAPFEEILKNPDMIKLSQLLSEKMGISPKVA